MDTACEEMILFRAPFDSCVRDWKLRFGLSKHFCLGVHWRRECCLGGELPQNQLGHRIWKAFGLYLRNIVTLIVASIIVSPRAFSCGFGFSEHGNRSRTPGAKALARTSNDSLCSERRFKIFFRKSFILNIGIANATGSFRSFPRIFLRPDPTARYGDREGIGDCVHVAIPLSWVEDHI